MSLFTTAQERAMQKGVCYFLTWEGIAAIGIIGGLGMTAYSLATAPGAPSYSAPLPPSNSTIYGEDGEILSRNVRDPQTGEWITYGPNSEPPKPATEWANRITRATETPQTDGEGNIIGYERVTNFDKDMQDPLIKAEVERRFQAHVAADPGGVAKHSGGWRAEEYDKMLNEVDTVLEQYNKDLADYNTKYAKWEVDKAERDAEKAKLAELRTTAMGNLNELSPERQAQIEQFGTAYADSMHRDIDPRFEKIKRNEDETANATGMFGSRAYVDTKAELDKLKATQDTDIANQSTMAKETLTNNDRTYWANLLGQIDAGQRSDLLANAQVQKSNADIASQNYAGTLGYYSAQNANKLADWEAKQRLSSSYASAGSNLAGGLLYLYGGKSGGGGGGGGGSSFNIAPTQTKAGKFSLMG
ncbi:MAG: hypothetical protein FD174_2571 [Geobacteraceae bacterium]|nr:MAG: hypothetical protein FD174_2571 [Geobacteraceae bacterium]